jgi:hypothetical protein
VRGSTLTYDSSHVQVGSGSWVHFSDVGVNERIVYTGSIDVPSTATWTYNTQVNWDTAACR